jgi:hypothetical protein
MPLNNRPLANRVAPDGALFATPERGLFLGNRGGRFHDPKTKTVRGRPFASRQWITCVTAFRGRSRDHMGGVWGRGYTELFFCDEVTALAAGHRPCMECRRADLIAYRAALMAGLGLESTPSCPDMDTILDTERRDGPTKRLHRLDAATLPDGAMLRAENGAFLAIRGKTALVWSAAGYVATGPRPNGLADVLTPPATLAALKAGYAPVWHGSAA